MLMAAVTPEINATLVGQRLTQPIAIIFKLLVMYQPGGNKEKQELLKGLWRGRRGQDGSGGSHDASGVEPQEASSRTASGGSSRSKSTTAGGPQDHGHCSRD